MKLFIFVLLRHANIQYFSNEACNYSIATIEACTIQIHLIETFYYTNTSNGTCYCSIRIPLTRHATVATRCPCGVRSPLSMICRRCLVGKGQRKRVAWDNLRGLREGPEGATEKKSIYMEISKLQLSKSLRSTNNSSKAPTLPPRSPPCCPRTSIPQQARPSPQQGPTRTPQPRNLRASPCE
jgi:hypothetical protein